MPTATPPGWPADLPPPGSQEFGDRVTGWLLDRCAPEVRGAAAIRTHPVALAHLARHHSEAMVAAQREAYRSARRELAEGMPAATMTAVLTDLEALGHQMVRTLREVTLVQEALEGTVWRAKL